MLMIDQSNWYSSLFFFILMKIKHQFVNNANNH